MNGREAYESWIANLKSHPLSLTLSHKADFYPHLTPYSFTWGKPVRQHGSLSSSNSVLVAWCKTVFTRVDPLRKKLERTSYLLQIFYQLLAIMSRIYLTILMTLLI